MFVYQHTQLGKVTLAVTVGVSLFVVGLMLEFPFWPGPFVILAMAILALLFHSLTVEVDQENLTLRFGIGLIRKKIPLRTVESVRQARHRWYFGYGIRLTPQGWIWIVSGLDAVELSLSNGKRFRVGTDEPGELMEALGSTGRIVVER